MHFSTGSQLEQPHSIGPVPVRGAIPSPPPSLDFQQEREHNFHSSSKPKHNRPHQTNHIVDGALPRPTASVNFQLPGSVNFQTSSPHNPLLVNENVPHSFQRQQAIDGRPGPNFDPRQQQQSQRPRPDFDPRQQEQRPRPEFDPRQQEQRPRPEFDPRQQEHRPRPDLDPRQPLTFDERPQQRPGFRPPPFDDRFPSSIFESLPGFDGNDDRVRPVIDHSRPHFQEQPQRQQQTFWQIPPTAPARTVPPSRPTVTSLSIQSPLHSLNEAPREVPRR